MSDFDVTLESSEINVTLVLERTVGGEGGGLVDSVNTLIGDVVLDQDDVLDGTTFKQYSLTEKNKLAAIAAGATANASDATLLARANHTGLQLAATISDFNTAADARAQAITDARISSANATDLTNGNNTTLHTHDSRYYTETEIDTLLRLAKFPNIKPTSGDYYSMGGQSSTASPGMGAVGTLRLHPIYLDAGTIDRIAVSTSVAAASTWRLGIYKANAITGLPDGEVPFLDAGVVNMNATAGVQAITISQVITEPGLYWLAAAVETYTAQPTTHNVNYSSNSGLGLNGLPQDMSSLGRYRVGRAYGSTIAAGGLPTCPTASMTWSGTIPRIAVRYA